DELCKVCAVALLYNSMYQDSRLQRTTALHCAVQRKNQNLLIVELLLAAGASCNTPATVPGRSTSTPWQLAVLSRVPALVELLYHCGADLRGDSVFALRRVDAADYAALAVVQEAFASLAATEEERDGQPELKQLVLRRQSARREASSRAAERTLK